MFKRKVKWTPWPNPLKRPITKDENIAYLFPPRLGDTLIALVTVNNLVRNGFHVAAFGNYAYALRDWFPHLEIHPDVKLADAKQLSKYSTVLSMDKNEVVDQLKTWHPHAVFLWVTYFYRAPFTMTDIQVMQCDKHLGLKNLVRVNDIKPLAGLEYRKFKQRVMLHPVSSKILKDWPAKKFLKLAQNLRARKLEPYFILPPELRETWRELLAGEFPVPDFSSLSEVAAWVYESGYFIGVDSGIGHLASNLGIPTLSIMLRNGMATQWRPSWSIGEVVIPPAWVNPKPLKEKIWKFCTSVSWVEAGFDRLLLKCKSID